MGLDETGRARTGHRRPAGRRHGRQRRIGSRTGAPMRRWEWYFVGVTIGPDGVGLSQQAVRRWPDDPSNAAEACRSRRRAVGRTTVRCWLAAARAADGGTGFHFDGGIDRPRAFGRPLSGEELLRVADRPRTISRRSAPTCCGAWDFSADIATDRVTDRSASGATRAPRRTCRRAASRATTTTAARPTSATRPSSTARSTSIATTSRMPAGRSPSTSSFRRTCRAASTRPGSPPATTRTTSVHGSAAAR